MYNIVKAWQRTAIYSQTIKPRLPVTGIYYKYNVPFTSPALVLYSSSELVCSFEMIPGEGIVMLYSLCALDTA